MHKPNCFIVGAPKCGTTALAHYLNQHPDVFVPEIKEPHYFINEDMPEKTKINFDEYIELFKGAENEKILIDASVWYLYGKNTARLIYNFDQNAKILVMLRRPEEMVVSMHRHAVLTKNEDVKSFPDAWGMCGKRRDGYSLPKYCKDKSMLFYDEIAAYGDQLERFLRYFSRDQVKVIFYEDFSMNTEKIFKNIQDFLNISPISLSGYQVVNPRRKARFDWLQTFIKRPNPVLVKFAIGLRNMFGIKRLYLMRFLQKINEKEADDKDIGQALKIEIRRNYDRQIQKLEELTERDLSEWRL